MKVDVMGTDTEETVTGRRNKDGALLARETKEVLPTMEPTIEVTTESVTGEAIEEEEMEELAQERVLSIIESILFSTDRPQSLSLIRQAFKGTNVTTTEIKKAIEMLKVEYAGGTRGLTLEEVSGGFQLRTKVDNMTYIKRMMKIRTFKLSGPALEVLSIVAYKQPCIKATVDEIRGVESGHLLRGLMDRGLVSFSGKSESPGKPMLYATTKKFLETFGLRNLKELPDLTEIDSLLPEGIGEVEEQEETLSDLTQHLSEKSGESYSRSEEELARITDELSAIDTSSEFFEQEKQRMKAKQDAERARDIREAMVVREDVSARDWNWLRRYEASQTAAAEDIEKPAEAPALSEARSAMFGQLKKALDDWDTKDNPTQEDARKEAKSEARVEDTPIQGGERHEVRTESTPTQREGGDKTKEGPLRGDSKKA